MNPAEASAIKVFGTELSPLRPTACSSKSSAVRRLHLRLPPGALIEGRVERSHRGALVLTFGGGTNEIQRDIIAMVGLGHAGSEALETD